jgi:hypothetical protein
VPGGGPIRSRARANTRSSTTRRTQTGACDWTSSTVSPTTGATRRSSGTSMPPWRAGSTGTSDSTSRQRSWRSSCSRDSTIFRHQARHWLQIKACDARVVRGCRKSGRDTPQKAHDRCARNWVTVSQRCSRENAFGRRGGGDRGLSRRAVLLSSRRTASHVAIHAWQIRRRCPAINLTNG